MIVTNQGNLWVIGTLLIAPCIGSWLGVAFARGVFAPGRSRCMGCGARLGVIDLVPIVSFLALRGRCRRCGDLIPISLLFIEVALLMIAVIAALVEPSGPAVALATGLGAVLFALAWIDFHTMRLPDAITLPLLLAGLIVCAGSDATALTAHAAAAALAYLGLRGIARLYRRLRGIEGIGAGDAKLLAAGGAWLGPAALPDVLVLAGISGLLWFGILAARGRLAPGQRIPFGPALALAIWVLWLHHDAQLS
ncbi:prepilin peptidase [Acidiphilium sp.]|uniref:prepilin peptidase n=1 Tax=Acidiphilium sp. TaxID=527 RepID=UPI003D02726D